MTIKRIRIIDIVLIAYIISVFLFTAELDEIYISNIVFVIYGILVFFNIFQSNHGKITLKNTQFFLPIFLLAVVTIPIAINSSLAVEKAQTLALLIILFIMIYNTYHTEGNYNYILIGFLIGGTILSVRVVSLYGIALIGNSMSIGMRVGRDILQLTYLGRYTYIAAIVALYLAYYKGKRIMFVLYAFCGFICVSSESRQSLITLIVVTTLLFLWKDFSKKKIYSLIRVMIVIAIVISLFRLPVLQAVTRRLIDGLTLQQTQYAGSFSDVKRIEMIRQGLIVFIHNPIFGIGLGGAREVVTGIISEYKYLHNNYAELLCCGGILGFIAYYSIYVVLFKRVRKTIILKGKNDELVLSIALLLGQLISDMFAVNYYGKIQYIIFAYCFLSLSRRESVDVSIEGE